MLLDGDAAAVSPRSQFDWHDVRFIGALQGRYTLSDRREGIEDKLPVYSCRLCSISTRLAVMVAPISGGPRETVVAYFDEFGIVRGKIFRVLPNGFVITLMLDRDEREKLGAKIVWQKRRALEQLSDKRAHKRIVPRDTRSLLTLADGEQVPCQIVDISQSGAAVSASFWPPLGTPMALGKIVGRVARLTETGFALQFVQIQEQDNLESLVAAIEQPLVTASG